MAWPGHVNIVIKPPIPEGEPSVSEKVLVHERSTWLGTAVLKST